MVDRRALLVDTSEYASLPSFRFARGSITELAIALEDPEIGDYDVTMLHDSRFVEASAAIFDHFRMASVDSELLLYLSGHVLTDGVRGGLYLGIADTQPCRVTETGYPMSRLRTAIYETQARNIVIILDGCYSMPMADVSLESVIASILDKSGGASSLNLAMFASSVEVGLADWEARPPLFTRGVLSGVGFGAADLDRDGVVTAPELHDYLTQFLHKAPILFSSGDARKLKVSAVPPSPGSFEELIVNPCPNCTTEEGHRYRVPVARDYIYYAMSPGPWRPIIRTFRVVFRCPVSTTSFAVTLRLQEEPNHNHIVKVGEPRFLPTRRVK